MVKLCNNLDSNKILQTYYSLGFGKYMNEIFISTREGYLPEFKEIRSKNKIVMVARSV